MEDWDSGHDWVAELAPSPKARWTALPLPLWTAIPSIVWTAGHLLADHQEQSGRSVRTSHQLRQVTCWQDGSSHWRLLLCGACEMRWSLLPFSCKKKRRIALSLYMTWPRNSKEYERHLSVPSSSTVHSVSCYWTWLQGYCFRHEHRKHYQSRGRNCKAMIISKGQEYCNQGVTRFS